MACRSRVYRVITVSILSSLSLTACGGAPEPKAPAALTAQGSSAAEAELRRQAKAMQKTILEGALAGGAAGAGIGFTFGGSDDSTSTGFKIGVGAGAAAGTYVAFVQRKYIRRERRLRQVKEDLDRNYAEMQTALLVMQQVAAIQKAELAALQARAVAGEAQGEDFVREVAEARDNLLQMQLAIDGATSRQEEFTEARSLTVKRGEAASPIDGDLALLSARIEEMRAVASDLAASL